MTSAPQSDPWLQAPGGAYSWLIRSEMSCPAARAYAKPRKACLIDTTRPGGERRPGPDDVGPSPADLDAVVEQPVDEPVRLGVAPLDAAVGRDLFGRPADERDQEGLRVLDHPVVLVLRSLGRRPAGRRSSSPGPVTPRRKISSWSSRMAFLFSTQKSAEE